MTPFDDDPRPEPYYPDDGAYYYHGSSDYHHRPLYRGERTVD